MSLRDVLSRIAPRGRFARALSVVAGGTAAAPALGVRARPLLTRLFGAADYGALAVYTSLVGIAAGVSSLSYKQAIPLPDDDRKAADVTLVALACVLGVAAVFGTALFVLRGHLERWTGTPGAANYALLVPIGVIGLGAYEVLTFWTARQKRFAAIARTGVWRSISQTGVQLGAGVAGLGAAGLVAGQFVGQWAGCFRLGRDALETGREHFRSSWRRVHDAAREYRRFPLLATPAQAINAVESSLTPLLLAGFFGSACAGLFALALRGLGIPFLVVGSAAQTVFLPMAAEAHQHGRLAEETERAFGNLLRVAAPVFAVISAGAPSVFAVAFGEPWREAGTYVQWLSVRTLFTVTVYPLVGVIFVLERQQLAMLFSSAQLTARVAAVLVGVGCGSPVVAIAALGTGTAVLWLGYLLVIWRLSGGRAGRCLRILTTEVAIAAPLAAPIVMARWVAAPDVVITGVSAITGAAALYLGLRRRRALDLA